MDSMADRPTPQDPPQEPAPEQAAPQPGPEQAPPPPADATAPLPPAQPQWTGPQGPQPAPTAAYGVPAGPGGPSRPRRWWGEATATTGSRIALVAAAVLAAVVLVAGAGLVGSFVVHRIADARFASGQGDGRWGDDGNRGGNTPFGNNGRGNGNGNGRQDGGQRGSDQLPDMRRGQGNGLGQGQGNGLGRGNGQMGGMLSGLGAVLHGEFTTTLTGQPAVMLFQVGEVTAFTEGKSLSVRSTDGFEATYALDADTTTVGGSPVTGDQVRVIAAKQGSKAVLVQTVGQGG